MRNIILFIILILYGCSSRPRNSEPVSDSGAVKASVKINKDANGLTVEQKNVADRLKNDNIPGSIKHLYVISTMSGDVILYSTVRGKVTSSGKRLTPVSVVADASSYESYSGFPININGQERRTSEVLQDDGTYGSSIEYLFWWDSRGTYHQHYPSGGQIIHVSDQPMNFPKIILNLEESKTESAEEEVIVVKKQKIKK